MGSKGMEVNCVIICCYLRVFMCARVILDQLEKLEWMDLQEER